MSNGLSKLLPRQSDKSVHAIRCSDFGTEITLLNHLRELMRTFKCSMWWRLSIWKLFCCHPKIAHHNFSARSSPLLPCMLEGPTGPSAKRVPDLSQKHVPADRLAELLAGCLSMHYGCSTLASDTRIQRLDVFTDSMMNTLVSFYTHSHRGKFQVKWWPGAAQHVHLHEKLEMWLAWRSPDIPTLCFVGSCSSECCEMVHSIKARESFSDHFGGP